MCSNCGDALRVTYFGIPRVDGDDMCMDSKRAMTFDDVHESGFIGDES